MNALVKIERARPYDPAIAEQICGRIALGEGLADICDSIGVERSSVWRWLKSVNSFADDYARARQLQLDTFADEIVPLSDTAQGMDSAGVQAVKLRTDNRKWLLSKLRADVYGDKLDVTSKGEALAAPSHQVDARVQSIVMQAAMRMRDGLDPEIAGLLE